jgi:hypothetical protein
MPSKYKIPLNIKIRSWYQRNLDPYFAYYKQAVKYAFKQTVQSYNLKNEWKGKVSSFAFQLFLIAIIYALWNRAEAISQMKAFIIVLIGIGIVVFANLIWHLLLAPVRLHLIEKHKLRTTWIEQLDVIAKEQRGVNLLVLDGFPYQEEYKSSKEHKITYRVGVQTTGRNSIEDVSVSIVKIANTEISVLPIKLRVMGNSQETIRVDPSTQPRQFFDVIEWYPQKSQIRICYHHDAYKDTFDIHSDYIALTLVAQGRNVMETECVFHLVLQDKEWLWYSEEDYKLLREAKQNGNTNEEL